MKPEDRKRLKQHIEMIVEHKEPKELLREHNLNIGNAKTYSDNNKPSDSEGSVTQNDKCIWVELDDPDIVLWATSCGNEFHIEFDKPSDNHMKYCCYCGKEIREG